MGRNNSWSSGWPPYVPVAERRKNAEKEVLARLKKGEALEPVSVTGNTIARTFWGKAWCNNVESYSDLASRLPRGRAYLRSGAVIDLKITPGKVAAKVMGTSLYQVKITLAAMNHT